MSEPNFGIGNGITITTGFDVSTQLPLDSRTVVNNLDELANIPSTVVYLGLLVFVIDENKLYQWKWIIPEEETEAPYIGWGPIESEVSTKEILDLSEIDPENTPVLMMQKNKKNFFPIVHEKSIYIEDSESEDPNNSVSLEDKYQTRYDEAFETENKTVTGSVNELNTKMEDTLQEFRTEIAVTLQNLKDDVAKMKQDVQDTMDQLEADIIADMNALQKELEDMIAEKQREMEAKMAEMDKTFEELMAEINRKIAALEATVQEKVDEMLQDVDNVILTDDQVNNFMEQINANLAELDTI